MSSDILITKRKVLLRKVSHPRTMDGGLVALKLALKGYGITVSDEWLQEAVSQHQRLSTFEIAQIAQEAGLFVRPVIMPVDYFFKAPTLPAIVATSSGGKSRWLVVWNRAGPLIQVMDIRRGQRRWLTEEALLSKLGSEPIELGTDEWLEQANSELFTASLRGWLVKLGFKPDKATELINTACTEWTKMATLDAATRMVESMVQYGGFRRGKEAQAAVEQLFTQAVAEYPNRESIPSDHWSLTPLKSDTLPSERLLFKGITVLQVLGRTAEASPRKPPASEEKDEARTEKAKGKAASKGDHSSQKAPPAQNSTPNIIDFLREDGLLTPSVLGLAAVLAAFGVVLQALLFRGFMEVGLNLTESWQRLGAIGMLFAFVIILLLLEWPIEISVSRIGRRLDARLRIAVLQLIPHLPSQYFQNFSTGDLIERIHNARALHVAPSMGSKVVRIFFQLLMTGLGIAFIDLGSAPIALLNAMGSLIVMSLGFSTLMERYMRLRTHLGSLSRFYLDSLLGLVVVRTHGAEQAVQREYESLLVGWGWKKWGLQRTQFWMSAANELLIYGLTALLMLSYVLRGGQPVNLLLLFFWGHNMALLGEQLMFSYQGYVAINSYASRFIKILSATKERDLYASESHKSESHKSDTPIFAAFADEDTTDAVSGIKIIMREVSVEAAKQIILSDINLTIEPGSHLAIVGPSGAGKSSLVGLLIGRYTKASGEVLIDGDPLSYERLQRLRHEIAWIDPAVQLWNRSLLQNLRYGVSEDNGGEPPPLDLVLEQADLLDLLGRLPDGLQTILGGGGRLVSGGQGQRVRFGRAMQRQNAGLAILDEPFRGLDREKRHLLLTRAREFWQDATLICVTHDVGETLAFERVLVIENGKIVEDGVPSLLAAKPDSRYRALLEAEEVVREKLWSGREIPWRHLWLEEGQLSERVSAPPKANAS